MIHPRVSEWERTLKGVFDAIDDRLESKYGGRYELHPARSRRGLTSNREDDGLFRIGAAFSAGYGSDHGPGYVVEIRMVTLEDVPENVRREIEDEVAKELSRALPKAFPGRELSVSRDGCVYKIHGDLSLGKL